MTQKKYFLSLHFQLPRCHQQIKKGLRTTSVLLSKISQFSFKDIIHSSINGESSVTLTDGIILTRIVACSCVQNEVTIDKTFLVQYFMIYSLRYFGEQVLNQ